MFAENIKYMYISLHVFLYYFGFPSLGNAMRMNPAGILIPLILLTMAACVHPISKGLRETLDPEVGVSGLFESPDNYIGKRVMLGGDIVETRNFPEKSEIEVVQKSVDCQGGVSSGNETLGRFIFRRRGYLESEIYSNGREIVGAGKVVGVRMGKIGGRELRFPVVEAEELHLYETVSQYPHYYEPFYPYYHPFSRHRHLYFW